MNLLGQVFSLIYLRIKLSIKVGVNKYKAIIILDFYSRAYSLGVVVDSIEAVVSFDNKDIDSIKLAGWFIKSEYIQGVSKGKKGLVIILNLEAIFYEADFLDKKINLVAS